MRYPPPTGRHSDAGFPPGCNVTVYWRTTARYLPGPLPVHHHTPGLLLHHILPDSVSELLIYYALPASGLFGLHCAE